MCSLGGFIVEERYEPLKEPWTCFVIEFPTYPKHQLQGREESQRILFYCPRAEMNTTELCLALFGSQILMHRMQEGESTEAQAAASLNFVYTGETPDALRAALAGQITQSGAPVLVTKKSNVVKAARMVTQYLGTAMAGLPGSAHPHAEKPAGQGLDTGPHAIPGDEDLYSENLPEITMVDEQGNVIHASHTLQDYRAEYACRYVLAHFHENINRDKMAEMVNLSPGYFSNLFRQEVGMSFSDYLIQVRVENAKSLLRRFDLSVDAISKRCGFHSLAHFSRTFKDRVGMSPLKFRKSPHS
jgi:AraC-like DNA-binding protein